MAAIQDIELTADLIFYALEKENDKHLWDVWLTTLLRSIDQQKYKSFEEFKKQSQVKESNKTVQEVEQETLAIIARHEGR